MYIYTYTVDKINNLINRSSLWHILKLIIHNSLVFTVKSYSKLDLTVEEKNIGRPSLLTKVSILIHSAPSTFL